MSRVRTRIITNIFIMDKDIKRLAQGKRVFKQANKHSHCIIPRKATDKLVKLKEREARIKAEIAKLESGKGSKKQIYIKRNTEYWGQNKGGFKFCECKPAPTNFVQKTNGRYCVACGKRMRRRHHPEPQLFAMEQAVPDNQ